MIDSKELVHILSKSTLDIQICSNDSKRCEYFFIFGGWSEIRDLNKELLERHFSEIEDFFADGTFLDHMEDTLLIESIIGDAWGFKDSYARCDCCGGTIYLESSTNYVSTLEDKYFCAKCVNSGRIPESVSVYQNNS